MKLNSHCLPQVLPLRDINWSKEIRKGMLLTGLRCVNGDTVDRIADLWMG